MDFDTRDSTTVDGDQAETQSLLAPPSTRSEHNATSSDQVGVSAPAQPNTSSNPGESDIWDYFESTRRSASYHLDEYFYFREDVRNEPAPAQPDLQGLGMCNTMYSPGIILLYLSRSLSNPLASGPEA